MVCIENIANKASKRPLPDDLNEAKRISGVCEAMGLLVRPLSHLVEMLPALTISEAECDRIAETRARAVPQVADKLTREGVRLA